MFPTLKAIGNEVQDRLSCAFVINSLSAVDVHLRDLRYFVAVAEELHFTRAAQRLYVSQPALSRQIAKLERDLRVTLLNRDRRTVELTDAGTELLDSARRLLADWDEAQRAASDAAATAAAVLRIGQQTSIGRNILEQLVAQLRTRRPTWRIELRQVTWDDPTAGLDDGTTDIALCWLPVLDDDSFHTCVLASEPIVIALPSTHHLAQQSMVEFAAIEHEPLLALPTDAGPLRDFWLAVHARNGVAAPVAGTVTTADETLDAVAAGLGAALMSTGNAELYRRPGVNFVYVNDLPPSRLALVWRAGDDRDIIRDVTDIAHHIRTHP